VQLAANPFSDPPLGLYVHIPWCVQKCPYCDFNSHHQSGDLPESQYIEALLQDLDCERVAIKDRLLESVFIGGGTPSLFQPDSIARLLAGVAGRFEVATYVEITLEANPGTVEAGRFREFVAAGVNRISIGVQSFDDTALQKIGRIHGCREAVTAVETARDSGASQVNLDLMYALPGQTPVAAAQDLHQAFSLGPDHISWYQLTLEPNTAFYRHPPVLPDADQSWAIQQIGQRLLAKSGYDRYEVSAYARPAARARHNLNYWRYGDYLGIGAGAHGKISNGPEGTVVRSIKQPHPRRYLEAFSTRPRCADLRRNPVEPRDRIFEFMLNALRLCDGFEPGLFEARTGLSLHSITARLERAAAAGLLNVDSRRIRASEFGQRFLDDLVALFLEPGGKCGGDPDDAILNRTKR